jgi:hypothetical protein
MFSRTKTPLFSQLILSWNAVRPSRGYFTFWAQTRGTRSGDWYDWHRVSDWGAGIQRSYISKRSRGSSHYYVRLEIPEMGDGFRIKVEAHDGASLADLRGLYICISDLENCLSEQNDPDVRDLASVYVHNVPQQSQMVLQHPRFDALCSPTSMSMVTGYFRREIVDPIDFARNSYDAGLDVFGSWPFNTAHAFERCNGTVAFWVQRLSSFKMLHNQLMRGIPVVVSVRGAFPGSASMHAHGHLLVVVGWDRDNQRVLCNDPAFESNEKTVRSYGIEGFLQAWERSKRLAYMAEPL